MPKVIIYPSLNHLPCGDLISQGLKDYSDGKETVEACLVKIASNHLSEVGVLTAPCDEVDVELTLYKLLHEHHAYKQDPYGNYNSLLRTLVSFERCITRESA